ncbi:MAG: hypothetical protein GKR87_13150 [Kiritimatiellae bacterium]|nr:hypothetical protein [Kiritimatiellia bacterium]
MYETPPEHVETAQRAMREKFDNDPIQLRGPAVFKDARYGLISSILNLADGSSKRKLLATGRAPVLEGNRMAFTFDLTPEKATLLLQSFAMKTPDVSLIFDLTFAGLNEAYEAELVVDWSETSKSMSASAGGTAYFISADIDVAFKRLIRNHAITLKSSGNDTSMEALLNNVYTKLLELMFRPVELDRVPKDKQGGLFDNLGELFNPKSGLLSSRNTIGYGAYAGYELKNLKTEGFSVMNFNHRSEVERRTYLTFNIGDFYQRFGKNPDYFRTVNLSDPAFQQREVYIGLDGDLLPEFNRYVNNVAVTLRKNHENGEQTTQELVLNREQLKNSTNDLRLIYGWNQDNDRLGWLNYEYRTRWSFKGGGKYQTDWIQTDAPMIDVYAPYERRRIECLGDPERFREKGVRAVVVKVTYDFFGSKQPQQLVIKPEQLA